MNLLILSGGRRTTLVESFRKSLGGQGRVIIGEVDGLAASAFVADRAIKLPRVGDPSYETALLDTVKKLHIKCVVPTIDTELGALHAAREKLASLKCTAVISAASLLSVASDKRETAIYFTNAGVKVPRWWDPKTTATTSLPDELFVKPRFGSASAGTYRTNPDRLPAVLDLVKDPIVQECINAPEVTVDALLDFNGRPVHYVPRRRLKTLGGESIQGVTIDDTKFSDWILGVLGCVGELGGIGPQTVQFFDASDGPILLEINPRFGGGYPLAEAAGGTYTAWLLELLADKAIPAQLGEYQRELFMTRSLKEQFVEAPKWQ